MAFSQGRPRPVTQAISRPVTTARVIGYEPYVATDFTGAEEYAKPS